MPDHHNIAFRRRSHHLHLVLSKSDRLLGHPDPFNDPFFSDLGPAIAEAVFNNHGLSGEFTEYLASCQREKGDVDFAKHSLARRGISEEDVRAMEEDVRRGLLNYEERTEFLRRLQLATTLTDLTLENCRDSALYRGLAQSFSELEKIFPDDDRLMSLLQELDPSTANRQELEAALSELHPRLKLRNRSERPSMVEAIVSCGEKIHRFDFTAEILFETYEVGGFDSDALGALRRLKLISEQNLPNGFIGPLSAKPIETGMRNSHASAVLFDAGEKLKRDANNRT